MTKQKWKERNKELNTVVDFLIERFPKAFFKTGYERPLAIGIHKTLIEEYNDFPDKPFSNMLIRDAIGFYVGRTTYMQSMKAGTMRIDLEGKDTISVEDEMAESAKKKLEMRHSRWEARRQKWAEAKERRRLAAESKSKVKKQCNQKSNEQVSVNAQSAQDFNESKQIDTTPIEPRRPTISLKKRDIEKSEEIAS